MAKKYKNPAAYIKYLLTEKLRAEMPKYELKIYDIGAESPEVFLSNLTGKYSQSALIEYLGWGKIDEDTSDGRIQGKERLFTVYLNLSEKLRDDFYEFSEKLDDIFTANSEFEVVGFDDSFFIELISGNSLKVQLGIDSYELTISVW